MWSLVRHASVIYNLTWTCTANIDFLVSFC
uniref:Uncharacterized protein n=1 Tax=Arundo donax TaxID=35708 RepID=A0A0A9CD83_ARUDO